MAVHNGKYYLQYAGPGTEWKTYADGVYNNDVPTGPFFYMENSLTSAKEGGFMCGARHGCLFPVGEVWWKAAINAISINYMFEWRVSFYPAGFDSDGNLWTDIYEGYYPLWLPGSAEMGSGSGWELLSLHKPVRVSSEQEGQPEAMEVDGQAHTEWVAKTKGVDEWLEVDLGAGARVAAVQVNFGEFGPTLTARDDRPRKAICWRRRTTGNDGIR